MTTAFRRFSSLLLIMLAMTIVLGSASEASATELRCRDLPDIEWYPGPIEVSALGVVSVTIPRYATAKHLYLQAYCGVRSDVVWGLVHSGEGAVVRIPEALATALDRAVPYMAKVDYMYVRGGGPDNPLVVYLFQNGYKGPIFHAPEPRDWLETDKAAIEQYLNALPYAYLRQASRWLHDIARYDSHVAVDVSVWLRVLGFRIHITDVEIPALTRPMASPLGTMFFPGMTRRNFSTWIHELAHFIHFDLSQFQAFLYADTYGRISWQNCFFGPVAIPACFRFRHAAARDQGEICTACRADQPFGEYTPRAAQCACDGIGGAPHGFTTLYSMCGEGGIYEDFADTASIVMGVSQRVHQAIQDRTHHLHDRTHVYRNSGCAGYAPMEQLYQRTGDDAAILYEKANYFYDLLGVHAMRPMDADGNGVTWDLEANEGDCDDTNPVVTQICAARCVDDGDCERGDPCTIARCDNGSCHYDTHDPMGNPLCPDATCDDAGVPVPVGMTRPCTNPCAIEGRQTCVAGQWTECDALPCACLPGEEQAAPCERCGTGTRTCQADGTWGPLQNCTGQGVCDPGDAPQQIACGQLPGCAFTGYLTRTCNAACQHSDTTCMGAPSCCPGQTEALACGACNAGTRTRQCDATGQWTSFSTCTVADQCCPGATQSQGCGRCGTETRTCRADGTWGAYGTCNEPTCCPGDSDTRSCNQCGTQTRDCRTSSWGTWSTCQGTGTCQYGTCTSNGTCSCTPFYCDSWMCGIMDDGCGGTVNCGGCTAQNHACQNNACLCQPQCTGKECGPNGCGGSCGTCSVGVCDAGICVPL